MSTPENIPADIMDAAAKIVGDEAFRLMALHGTAVVSPETVNVVARGLMAEREREKPQTLETAPKDGTRILAFFPDDEGWLTVKWGWRAWHLEPDGGTEFEYEITGDPTHWRHLPENPS